MVEAIRSMPWAVGTCVAALCASAAVAVDKGPQTPPALYTKLSECRAIGDAAQRLSCYDAASAELDAAVVRKDIYMTDKAQIQKTRKTLFGLPLPNLGIFGGGDDDDNEENRIAELQSTVKLARQDGAGWLITIAEGSAWRQMDGAPLALAPKPGMPVVIKRGALNNYKMSIRKQPPIKVKRVI